MKHTGTLDRLALFLSLMILPVAGAGAQSLTHTFTAAAHDAGPAARIAADVHFGSASRAADHLHVPESGTSHLTGHAPSSDFRPLESHSAPVSHAANVHAPSSDFRPLEASKARATEATAPYKRPSNATIKDQRVSVQGKTCVDCGTSAPKMYADHKVPLVKEHYQTGKIDTVKMKQIDAVQPQCPSCSNKQGAELSRYSREQKKLIEK